MQRNLDELIALWGGGGEGVVQWVVYDFNFLLKLRYCNCKDTEQLYVTKQILKYCLTPWTNQSLLTKLSLRAAIRNARFTKRNVQERRF